MSLENDFLIGSDPDAFVDSFLDTGSIESSSTTSDVDANTLAQLLKEREKRQKRLARKAELAKIGRQRKKMLVENLEKQVATLKEELAKERQKRKLAEEKLAEGNEDFISLPPELANGSDQQLLDLKRVNLAKRQKLVHFKSSQPLPLQFLDWFFSQTPRFYDDPNSLWHSVLKKELRLSDQQMERIESLRSAFDTSLTPQCDQLLSQLQKAVDVSVEQTHSQLDVLSDVLSPQQLSHFLKWIDSFGAVCVQIKN